MRSKLAFVVALSVCGHRPGAAGAGAEAGRHAAHLSSRQPAQRLDPRGGHHLDGAAVHGRLQQPGRCSIRQKPLNSTETIVPDLAESWAWDATKTKLTFKLRQGVKWHDGKPFTAKDVQCTWNKLTGKDPDDFRKNPRAIWWQNLKEVTVNGDHEATFVLNRPQPSFLIMFASGYTPVYPCHVSTKDMRTNPIGTGPFKFVEFKRGESVKFVRNPDYWKKGKPYLDAIEWKVIENRSTRILAFVAGEFDMTFYDRRHDPAAEGRDSAGAQGRLRAGADLRVDQPDHQSRGRRPSTIPRSARPWRWRSTARPSSTS